MPITHDVTMGGVLWQEGELRRQGVWKRAVGLWVMTVFGPSKSVLTHKKVFICIFSIGGDRLRLHSDPGDVIVVTHICWEGVRSMF